MDLGIGEPVPLSQISDPAIDACADDMSQAGSTAAQSLAVPISADVTVASSQPVTVSLRFDDWASVSAGGAADTGSLGNMSAWASEGGDGPACNQFDGSSTGLTTWTSLASQATGHFTGWYVVFGAVTPNDPTGHNSLAYQLLLPGPSFIVLNGAHPSDAASSGVNVVRCGSTGSPYLTQYIAVDPATARQMGCKPV